MQHLDIADIADRVLLYVAPIGPGRKGGGVTQDLSRYMHATGGLWS